MKTKIKYYFIYSLLLMLSVSLIVSCGRSPDSDKVITDKDDMVAAFASVDEAIPRINDLSKGTLISEFTGFFMPAGNVVKDVLDFEKTEKGIHHIITQTYTKGDPDIFDNVSNEAISDTAYYQCYPKEGEPQKSFDKAEKLTVSQNEKGKIYKIDWSPEETEYYKSHFIQYLYSVYIIDNNGYLVESSIYANSYEKESDGAKSNVVENTLKVKLIDYSK